MKNSCYHCQNRSVDCHGDCPKYADYRKQREEVYLERRFSQKTALNESSHYRDGWGFRRNGR